MKRIATSDYCNSLRGDRRDGGCLEVRSDGLNSAGAIRVVVGALGTEALRNTISVEPTNHYDYTGYSDWRCSMITEVSAVAFRQNLGEIDRKSTRLNSSHLGIS